MLTVVCPMCGADVHGFQEDSYNGGWDTSATDRQKRISCPNREECGHIISAKMVDATDDEPALLVSGPDVEEGKRQFMPGEYEWREAEI